LVIKQIKKLEEIAEELKEKSVSTKDLVLSIGQMYTDHIKSAGRNADSLLESRFTPAQEAYNQKIRSCGSFTNVSTTMLRHLGYRVKKIHGETDRSVDHTWIKVYIPEKKIWQEFDLTKSNGKVGPDYLARAEVDDWEEIRHQLEKEHKNYQQRLDSWYKNKGVKMARVKSGLLKKHLDQDHQQLCQFFNINWNRNKPGLIVVHDRHSLNVLHGCQTSDWVIGFTKGNDIVVLDLDKIGVESSHTNYSPEKYRRLIKHELVHFFYHVKTRKNYPVWLNEGLAIYLSDQLPDRKTIPEKLTSFLRFYQSSGKEVYIEAGYFVQILVEKFGKDKLFKLFNYLKQNSPNQQEFARKFADIYGFELEYSQIDKLYPLKK